jgi:hypothetical protein
LAPGDTRLTIYAYCAPDCLQKSGAAVNRWDNRSNHNFLPRLKIGKVRDNCRMFSDGG